MRTRKLRGQYPFSCRFLALLGPPGAVVPTRPLERSASPSNTSLFAPFSSGSPPSISSLSSEEVYLACPPPCFPPALSDLALYS